MTLGGFPITPSLTTPVARWTSTSAANTPSSFWEDHTDQHVKILDVHFADRSRG